MFRSNIPICHYPRPLPLPKVACAYIPALQLAGYIDRWMHGCMVGSADIHGSASMYTWKNTSFLPSFVCFRAAAAAIFGSWMDARASHRLGCSSWIALHDTIPIRGLEWSGVGWSGVEFLLRSCVGHVSKSVGKDESWDLFVCLFVCGAGVESRW